MIDITNIFRTKDRTFFGQMISGPSTLNVVTLIWRQKGRNGRNRKKPNMRHAIFIRQQK